MTFNFLKKLGPRKLFLCPWKSSKNPWILLSEVVRTMNTEIGDFPALKEEVLCIIATNYLQTTLPWSRDERNEFKEYLKEIGFVLTGASVGSLVIKWILFRARRNCGKITFMVTWTRWFRIVFSLRFWRNWTWLSWNWKQK